jgi:mRNA interferase MazF
MGPRRGEVWLVDLGYIAKVRPGLVLSIEPLDTDRALVTLVPHTTSPRGTRFEVDLKPAFLKRGAFDAQNPVTAPLAKLLKKVGVLTTDEMKRVEDAVRTWLGL